MTYPDRFSINFHFLKHNKCYITFTVKTMDIWNPHEILAMKNILGYFSPYGLPENTKIEKKVEYELKQVSTDVHVRGCSSVET